MISNSSVDAVIATLRVETCDLKAAFCQPHPGCFCQSEQFSCLRFLSWGDYFCVTGRGYSESREM